MHRRLPSLFLVATLHLSLFGGCAADDASIPDAGDRSTPDAGDDGPCTLGKNNYAATCAECTETDCTVTCAACQQASGGWKANPTLKGPCRTEVNNCNGVLTCGTCDDCGNGIDCGACSDRKSCVSCVETRVPQFFAPPSELRDCLFCRECFHVCRGSTVGCEAPPATRGECDQGSPDQMACDACRQCASSGACRQESETCSGDPACTEAAAGLGNCPL